MVDKKKYLSALCGLTVVLFLTGCVDEKESYNMQDEISENIYTEEEIEINTDEISEESGDETIDKMPPEEEYDEIVLNDERYYLCKKVESGFEVNSELYGIYDSEIGEWVFDYRELEGDTVIEFFSHGCGMFSYKCSLDYGNVVFLSAELGDSFRTNKIFNRENIEFINGKGLVLFGGYKTKAIGTGRQTRLSPDNKLCFVTLNGEIEEVYMPEFEADMIFDWSISYITEAGEEKIYANCFDNYISGEEKTYLYVYFYEDGTYTIIDNQEYLEKIIDHVGDNSDNTNVIFKDGLIRVERLRGEDGKLYYAEFDKEGKLVTEATPLFE